jgi:hypothetical protein
MTSRPFLKKKPAERLCRRRVGCSSMKTDSALEHANTTAGTTLSHGGRNAHGGGRGPEHVATSIAGLAAVVKPSPIVMVR